MSRVMTEIVCNHSEQIFVWDSKYKYCYDVGGGLVVVYGET